MWQEFNEKRKTGKKSNGRRHVDLERAILHRRKTELSEVIQVTDPLLENLQKHGLLSENAVQLIQPIKDNRERMKKVIDELRPGSEAFSTLCDVFDEAGYNWLSRDLMTELRIEREDFHPEAQLVDEAAMLVHRKFGTSKRFSETDKKEMAEMMALIQQISRSEWQRKIQKLRVQLKNEQAEMEARQKLIASLTDVQRTFVREHESQLVSHAHDMETTRQLIQRILREVPPGGDELRRFKENLETFLRQMSSALNQRDSLYYEKQKCLRLLGVAKVNDDSKIGLDEVISKATGLTLNSSMETVDKDQVIEKLREKISDMEKQNALQERSIKQMRRQIAERDREISKLRQRIQVK